MPDDPIPGPHREWVPLPDPTRLTTEQIIREVSSLRDLLLARIESYKELSLSRFSAMDEAVRLLQENANRQPTSSVIEQRIQDLKLLHEEKFHSVDVRFEERNVHEVVEKRIRDLRDLHDEKFDSIQTQFTERDTRTEQTSRDSKVAVDAALQAAKEAVGEQNKSSASAISKSEAATTKQIDQMGVLISSTSGALNDKIEDLKERLTRIESMGIGVKTSHDNTLALVAICVSAAGLIFLVVKTLMGR